jgi:hypothetical protein
MDKNSAPVRERLAILQWTARIGVVTADVLARIDDTPLASARSRLSFFARERLLERRQLLVGEPALYTITRAGMRQAALTGPEPCRVSAANASHLLACARAAATLQRRYPDHAVMGERELREAERRASKPLASATVGPCAGRPPHVHRPDLVLWPRAGFERAPVAVEVELTVKAPRRLAEICRGWARSREIAGVLYIAPEPVQRALAKAIEQAHAADRIVVVPLESVDLDGERARPSRRTITSAP